MSEEVTHRLQLKVWVQGSIDFPVEIPDHLVVTMMNKMQQACKDNLHLADGDFTLNICSHMASVGVPVGGNLYFALKTVQQAYNETMNNKVIDLCQMPAA